MSTPSDVKKPLPTSEEQETLLTAQEQAEASAPQEAPPSYVDASKSSRVIGDGNVFTDALPPRPGASRPGMTYSAPAQREQYLSRAERSGKWSFSMFDCFRDPGASAKACCCPCVTYGQTRHRLRSPNTPAPIFSMPCLGYYLSCAFIPGSEAIFRILQRNEMRQRLNINQPKEGGIRLGSSNGGVVLCEGVEHAVGCLDDIWRHMFCGCCALVQEEREIVAWERSLDEGGLASLQVGEDGIREEGERLLGNEGDLMGLRGSAGATEPVRLGEGNN